MKTSTNFHYAKEEKPDVEFRQSDNAMWLRIGRPGHLYPDANIFLADDSTGLLDFAEQLREAAIQIEDAVGEDEANKQVIEHYTEGSS